jgi:hypothetical protein
MCVEKLEKCREGVSVRLDYVCIELRVFYTLIKEAVLV